MNSSNITERNVPFQWYAHFMRDTEAPLSGRRREAARKDVEILNAARAVFLADPEAPVSAVAAPYTTPWFKSVAANPHTRHANSMLCESCTFDKW